MEAALRNAQHAAHLVVPLVLGSAIPVAFILIGAWFSAPVVTGLGATLTLAAWLGAWALRVRPLRAEVALRKAGETQRLRYERDLVAWQELKAAWDNSEAERISRIVPWLQIHVDIPRLDVICGPERPLRQLLRGLVPVLARDREVIVVDMSRNGLCAELTRDVDGQPWCVKYELPQDLGALALLAGWESDKIANLIVELSSDDHQDIKLIKRGILARITRTLGSGVTMARIHEALCYLLGDGLAEGSLTAEERRHLTKILSDDHRAEASRELVTLAAFTESLRDVGVHVTGPAWGRVTFLSVGDGLRDTVADLIGAVLVQSLTQNIKDTGQQGGPAIVLIGAEEQPVRHIRQLAYTCERFDAPLYRFFLALTDDVTRHLDRSRTAIMRQPNYQLAELLSSRVWGQEVQHVQSQATTTRGESESNSVTRTETASHTTGTSQTHTTSSSQSTTSEKDKEVSTTSGTSTGESTTTSAQDSYSVAVSRSRMREKNRSEAVTVARLREPLIDPAIFMNLRDSEMIFPNHAGVLPDIGWPPVGLEDGSADAPFISMETDPMIIGKEPVILVAKNTIPSRSQSRTYGDVAAISAAIETLHDPRAGGDHDT